MDNNFDLDIVYLEPKDAVFKETTGGFISLDYNNSHHDRVNIHRCFPFSAADKFISVRNKDNKEIGIIRDLDQFDKKQVAIIKKQLEIRYFTPIIVKINKITEEYGYTYWDTQTNIGICRFTVRNERSNYLHLPDSRIIVIDIDGNRFEIEDANRLNQKELRKVLFI